MWRSECIGDVEMQIRAVQADDFIAINNMMLEVNQSDNGL